MNNKEKEYQKDLATLLDVARDFYEKYKDEREKLGVVVSVGDTNSEGLLVYCKTFGGLTSCMVPLMTSGPIQKYYKCLEKVMNDFQAYV